MYIQPWADDEGLVVGQRAELRLPLFVLSYFKQIANYLINWKFMILYIYNIIVELIILEDKFTNKDWFEYIKKINDRELSKKSSNGITLWAIMGLFSYLLIELLKSIQFISIPENMFNVILYVTVFNNIVISLTMTFSIFSYSSVNQERTIINELSSKVGRIVVGFIFLWALIISCLNFYIGHNSVIRNLHTWAFYSVGVFFSLNTMFFLLNEFFEYTSIKRHGYPKIENSFLAFINTNFPTKIVLSIFNLLFGIIVYIQVRDILNSMFISDYDADCIKIALQIIGIIFCMFSLLTKYLSGLRDTWLNNFERKIILEDLSSEKIKNLFISEYVGKTTLSWLKDYSSTVEENLASFCKSIEALDKNIVEFSIADFDVKDAITLIESNLDTFTKINISKDEMSDYIGEKVKILKYFAHKGTLSESEKELLEYVCTNWIDKLEYFITILTDVVKPKIDNSSKILSEIESIIKK